MLGYIHISGIELTLERGPKDNLETHRGRYQHDLKQWGPVNIIPLSRLVPTTNQP